MGRVGSGAFLWCGALRIHVSGGLVMSSSVVLEGGREGWWRGAAGEQ